MIAANVLSSVFLIREPGSNDFGTGFVLNIKARQFCFTARHVFTSVQNSFEIFLHNAGWTRQKVIRTIDPSGGSDVLIFEVDGLIPKDTRLDIGEHFFVSQDLFFLGYPHGMFTPGPLGRPIPLVKKAICSGFSDPHKKFQEIYFEGLNNAGFSGGPLLLKELDTQNPYGRISVIGVVTDYQPEFLLEAPPGNQSAKPITSSILGNTGIGIAKNINKALTYL